MAQNSFVAERGTLRGGGNRASQPLEQEHAMEPWMIGAIAGAVVGWVILLLFGPRGHFEAPNIWVASVRPVTPGR